MGARLRRISGLAFVAPVGILLLVFVYSPLVMGLALAFARWNGIRDATWVGLDNFSRLAASADFVRIALNNAVLLGGLVVWVAIPFVLAVLLHQRRGSGWLRTIYLIPVLLPPVIVGRLFRFVLAEDGLLSATLVGLGLGAFDLAWLSDDKLVLLSVIFVVGWGTFGVGVLYYSTGLATMSQDLVDAARVDGANWFQLLRHIYFPALLPITQFWTLILTVFTLTAMFAWIHGLTRGGPGYASTTFDYRIYQTGLRQADYGTAAAIAVIAIVYLVIALLAGRRILRSSI